MSDVDAPLISVIIPTYNGGPRILDAVRTIEKQSHPNIETVVVIDGSQDNTVKTLEVYKACLPADQAERLHIIHQENKGVSAARNAGISLARGNLVAILDDDDQWQPQKLARQLAAVSQYGSDDPFLCTTDYYAIDQKTRESELIKNVDRMTLEGSLRAGFPPPTTWFFSRKTFDAVGGFDERLHAGEDADFVITLRKLNAHLVNVNEPLASYTLPEFGKTYKKENDSALRTLQKHGVWYAATFDQQAFDAALEWHGSKMPPLEGADVISRVQASRADAGVRDQRQKGGHAGADLGNGRGNAVQNQPPSYPQMVLKT